MRYQKRCLNRFKKLLIPLIQLQGLYACQKLKVLNLGHEFPSNA
jgi:hypothetical protein